MPLTRASSALKNKINKRAVGNRAQEATAEDFQEIGSLLDEYATAIESLTGTTQPNPNYGIYSSLTLLQATYPTAEENAYAIIDTGLGNKPYIAYWNDTAQKWELAVTVLETQSLTVISQGDIVTNIRVTDDNGADYLIAAGVLEGTNPLRFEDYAKNKLFIKLK